MCIAASHNIHWIINVLIKVLMHMGAILDSHWSQSNAHEGSKYLTLLSLVNQQQNQLPHGVKEINTFTRKAT